MSPMQTERKVNWPRLHHAQVLAQQLYPGAVGTLVSRELEDWGTHGYRLGNGRGLMDQVLRELEAKEGAFSGDTVVHRIEVEG